MNSPHNPFDLFPGSIPIGPNNRYKPPDQKNNQKVLETILQMQLDLRQSRNILILSPHQIETLVWSANAPFTTGPDDGLNRRKFIGGASVVFNPSKNGGHESWDAIKIDYINYHAYLRALAKHIGVNLDALVDKDGQPLIKPSRSLEVASFLLHNQAVIPEACVMSLAHLLTLVVSSPEHLRPVMKAMEGNSKVWTLVRIELEEFLAPLRSTRNRAFGKPPQTSWPILS